MKSSTEGLAGEALVHFTYICPKTKYALAHIEFVFLGIVENGVVWRRGVFLVGRVRRSPPNFRCR